MKLTRDNIKVFRDLKNVLHIDVVFSEDKSYGVTVAGEESTMQALTMLWETIITKEIGIGIHDTIMAVNDCFESEQKKDG
jgi:hypothetical protein